MSDASIIQALPTTNQNSVDVLESLLNVDEVGPALYSALAERVDLGVKKYGSRLKTYNDRNAFIDCRQEALDGIMYGQQLKLQGQDDGRIRNGFIRLVALIDAVEKFNATAKECGV